MPLQIGIVGLPNVGKSTLFRALTRKAVPCENYPFCTIDPNVGVVAVPDERLDALARVSKSAKVVPTTIEFVDIAGLVAGAHKGEGLGNKFLSHIREVDAIAEVVRVFEGGDVIHVAGRVDPASDVATIDLELAMADLTTVRKRMDTVVGKAKSGDKESLAQLTVLQVWERHLNAGQPIRDLRLTTYDSRLAKELQLLSAKPLLYVLNVDDREQFAVPEDEWRKRYAFLRPHPPTPPLPEGGGETKNFSPSRREGEREGVGAPFIVLCAKLEAELAELSNEDAAAMRRDLVLSDTSGLDRLIHAAYNLLGLITFLTSGPTETRAWTVPRGTKAPQAAGVIHTDFEKGFIRAEVIDWRDFVEHGEAKCKDLGRMRLEGKEYEIRDGDTIFFRVST
ncbi:redox-regulated ATPase YchF [Candidatus Uhrbacteria bacterium]|nr:redox-regulated ATPase YchF [Candidatus Uhrbacteria bacterium]